jgi:hypothetical protein
MVERVLAFSIIAIILLTMTVTTTTPNLHIGSAQAQEEVEKSGDLTVPEDDRPFGGDNAGTYSIGQDRYGLRIQVDMDSQPTNGTVYEGWLVDNATGNTQSVGQLVDDELAVTQEITNSSSYNLIEVTEEPVNDSNPSRNQSAVVAGAELES